MRIPERTITLLKIFYNYQKRRTVINTFPIRLWIESSLICNLKCTMCPNKEIQNSKKGAMDFELYKKIIDEARDFANDMNIHHRGEPLTNRRLGEMIRYAVEAGLKVRFHTNGTLLDRDAAQAIIAAQPDWVSISFDGLQKDIYEQVRKGAHFETTVSNILGFLDARKQARTRRPYTTVERIDFHSLQGQVDATQVNQLAALFRQRGLDELIVKDEYHWATESAPDSCQPLAGRVCTFPWYAMVICWDGTVTPCPQDYMAGMKLGNVCEKSIKDIWNDTPYRELRKKLVNDVQALSLCRKCDRLCRRQVAGVPFQYMITFLTDHLVGYGGIRRVIGSFERN